MQQDPDSHSSLKPPSAALILEDGKVFWGLGLGAKTANIRSEIIYYSKKVEGFFSFSNRF